MTAARRHPGSMPGWRFTADLFHVTQFRPAEWKGLQMKNIIIRISAAGLILMGPLAAQAEPLKTMDEVGAAIQACWKSPADIKNSSVTLSFSLKRDGSLIGAPKPTAINVEGDEKARTTFVDTAIKSLQACLPLNLSPALANGIAGTIYTMRFATPGN